MSLKSVLKAELDSITPDKEVVEDVKNYSRKFIDALKGELDKEIYGTEVFVGGSFAKNTLIKKDKYDVDIFVRFDWRYDDLSGILSKALTRVCKSLGIKYEVMHGSRDYFRVFPREHKAYLEIIPVTKIKKPREARNVTDLSYFHVSYVKKKAKGLEGDIRLAKRFFEAQRVYGAESYVQGFSGYASECLIIHYKSFEKMIKELSRVKIGERLIIDIEKHYKSKRDVLFELNESKLHSPIIVVDPTFKERNALASLSQSTFERFQDSAKKFLKNPSRKYFQKEKVDYEKMAKSALRTKSEFLHIRTKTDRQKGDIAGTKLRKFHQFILSELAEYFVVKKSEFDYEEGRVNEAENCFILKKKKEIIRQGPPINSKNKKVIKALEKHIRAFRAEHPKAYEKNGSLYAKITLNLNSRDFIKNWMKENKVKIADMGIVDIKVV